MSLIKEQYELIKPNNISLNEIKQRLKLHWIESSIIIHIEDIKHVLSNLQNDAFIKKKINPLTLPFKPNITRFNNNNKIKQRIVIEETTDESSFPKDKYVIHNKPAYPLFVIDKQHSINIYPHLQVELTHSEQMYLNDNYGVLNNTIKMQSLLLSPIRKVQETQSSFSSFTQDIHLDMNNDININNNNNILQTEIKTPIIIKHKQQQQWQSEYNNNKHLPQNFSNCVYIKSNIYNNKYESLSFTNINNNINNNKHSIPLQIVSSPSPSTKPDSQCKFLLPSTYKPQKYYIKDY